MDVAAGRLLTTVAFGANLVQLLVVPTVALEPADVVETSLVGDPCCQRFDAQVEGYGTIITHGALLAFVALLACLVVLLICFALLCIIVDERAIVVASCIPGYGHLAKVLRRGFSEMGDDVGIALGSPFATSACGKNQRVALYFQVHRWIAKGEELMSRLEPWKSWFLLSCFDSLKEGLHGLVQAEVHFMQELTINAIDLWVIHSALCK